SWWSPSQSTPPLAIKGRH
ncbi:unnamed protein product, partial [Rotaria sordida]